MVMSDAPVPKSGYSKTAVSTEAPPLRKRIVICCDGTWQSATSLDPTKEVASNVARLSRVLANAGIETKRNPTDEDKVWQQVVYYDAGIGTGDVGPLEPLRQGSLGSGLNENILEAYNFIVNNYAPGDKLYFFGFSRGAFTVRAVAGLVCHIGILKPSFMSFFIHCYGAYLEPTKEYPKEVPHQPFSTCKPWKDFMERHAGVKYANCSPENVDIDVIGVWDTVGSLGVPDLGHLWKYHKADPSTYANYDTDLHPQVRHAFQALALDEKRGPFSPSVWKLKSPAQVQRKDGTWGPPEGTTAQRNKTSLLQCWFPGAHVNVGGGSSSNASDKLTGDREQLASISYAWMLDRIRPFLALSEEALQAQLQEFKTLIDKQKIEEQGWSVWDAPKYFKSFLVKSTSNVMPVGYALGNVDESYTTMYQFMGTPEIRTPGKYHNPKAGSDGMVEYTTERIHPSVHYRQVYEKQQKELGKKEGEVYHPISMKGWKREYEERGFGRDFKQRKGYKWVLRDAKGEVLRSLWEFELGDMPEKSSVEMKLIEASWAKDIHDEVKKQWATV